MPPFFPLNKIQHTHPSISTTRLSSAQTLTTHWVSRVYKVRSPRPAIVPTIFHLPWSAWLAEATEMESHQKSVWRDSTEKIWLPQGAQTANTPRAHTSPASPRAPRHANYTACEHSYTELRAHITRASALTGAEQTTSCTEVMSELSCSLALDWTLVLVFVVMCVCVRNSILYVCHMRFFRNCSLCFS